MIRIALKNTAQALSEAFPPPVAFGAPGPAPGPPAELAGDAPAPALAPEVPDRADVKEDPQDAAYLLANVIPRLVTTEINPAASKGTLQGGLFDLVDRMRNALPPEVDISKADWLDARQKGGEVEKEGEDEGEKARLEASRPGHR